MTLGEKLKSLRERRGWTQSQAAERLGISSQVVSNYERDYRSPDKETLSRIAKVYNCSLDWLLGVSDNPERNDDPSPSIKKEKPVNRAFLELPEDTTEEEREFLQAQLDLQLEMFRKLKKRNQK